LQNKLILFDIIKELTEIAGPIGHEDIIQQNIVNYITDYVEEISITPIGNLIAHVGGSGKKLVIETHADEICHIVQSIRDDGFVRFIRNPQNPEYLDPYTIGQNVLIIGRKGKVPGIFASATGHLRFKNDRTQLPSWKNSFLDLGLSNRDEVEAAGIYPGAPIIWDVQTRRLGTHIVGKAMDARVGLALLIQMIHELSDISLKYDLYIASTIQEEMGLLGAQALYSKEQFDLGIALDVAIVGDIPGGAKERMPVRLGGGPVVVHRDSRSAYNRDLSNYLVKLAKKSMIPIQEAAFYNYGSDGGALLTAGIPNALLAWPTRYTHSPFEMIHEQDIHDLLSLLKTVLSNNY